MKRRHSAEEIANDPSLRWVGYRRGESVWSEIHQQEFRFLGYEPNGSVRLATLNGIAPIDQTVHHLSIRRLTSRDYVPSRE